MIPTLLSDLKLYLLFSAGAETTCNAVAGGLLALAEHPDRYAALRAHPALLGSAVEEMVRWTSPSPSKRRTATRDVMLGGCAVKAGYKVQVWEGSANRDESVFAAAGRFDIARTPNPHLGFGQGVHYCLGANLTRLALRVLYEDCWPGSRAFRWCGPSNGPAATGTPASATSSSPCSDFGALARADRVAMSPNTTTR